MDPHTMSDFAKTGRRVIGESHPKLRISEPPLSEQLLREAGRLRMHATGLEQLAGFLERAKLPPSVELGILVLLQRARA